VLLTKAVQRHRPRAASNSGWARILSCVLPEADHGPLIKWKPRGGGGELSQILFPELDEASSVHCI
jgi:hypothetical protein